MILLDVHVVLAAHRNDHPQFGVVRPWFDDLLESGESFAVPDVVWASFVRIATNRRIFEVPTPLETAFDFVKAVRAQPGYVDVVPGDRHFEIFEELSLTADAAGDLSPDAYVASIAVEQGCTLASLDRDFARFDNLDWIRPGAG